MSGIKVFYGEKDNNDCRLVPSPMISIDLQFNYVNDTIIGYTYILTLNGTVTALDLRNFDPSNKTGGNVTNGIGAVVDHMHKLRNILSKNGNVLHVTKTASGENKSILKAKGGILRSFNFNDSENNWHQNAKYTAELEFHTVDFIGAKFDGNSGAWQTDPSLEESFNSTIFLSSSGYPKDDYSNILDVNTFKVKTFSDSWSINFDSDSSFNKIHNTENDQLLNIDNTSYQIQYDISATGKNFYTYDSAQSEDSSESKLLPAWEQAKNFVQYRLYYQVTNLLNQILENNTGSSCSGVKDLTNAHAIGGSEGLLKEIGNDDFMVFNETISCSVSESKGTFSASYSAIVKNKTNNNFSLPEAKHTISKKHNVEYKAGVKYHTISLDGNIEGLIEGGLIRSSKPIELPRQGSLFIYNSGGGSLSTKYENAKKLLDKIYISSTYENGSPESKKKDFSSSFKNLLGITLAELEMTAPSDDPRIDAPHPTSFNITHNYDGTISYSAEYTNKTNPCGRKYSEISIATTNPNPVIATFTIPNNGGCAVIQDINTVTSKTVSVTIRGVDLSNTGKYYITNGQEWLNELDCMTCNEIGSFPVSLPDGNNTILTQKQYTKNPLDGSFSINLEYICNPGCNI